MLETLKDVVAKENKFLEQNKKFTPVLANFVPIILTPSLPQQNLLDTFAELAALANHSLEANEVKEKIYHYGVSPKTIQNRQVNILGYLQENKEFLNNISIDDIAIFDSPKTKPEGKNLAERMQFFGKIVDEILAKAYSFNALPPDDIIHVSCSGYLAPSPVEKLVSTRHWVNTTVTHSYHMGCYGSLPALRMATGFLAASQLGLSKAKSQIDIIHTEFLTLHLNLVNLTPRDILAMTLFGDGFIKYSLYPKEIFQMQNTYGLEILALKETIIPNTLSEMLWNLSSHNFEMILSKKIPFIIRDNILPFVESLMLEVGLDFAKDKEKILFAIHPGGPKIIEFIQRSLKLNPEQVAFSQEILSNFGNMSSATLPYIWEKTVASNEIPVGTLILSIAFGPGLTAAGAIMRKTIS